MKHRHLKSIGIALVLCLSLLSGCAKPVQMADKDENVILCTTFAAYDWVREILGDTDTFTCRMLVDNGVDLHSYQPSAQDIMKIANCRMLVYVGGESDTWVSDALVESGNENIVAISLLDLVGNRALNEVELEGVEEHHHHDHDDHDHCCCGHHHDHDDDDDEDEHEHHHDHDGHCCCGHHHHHDHDADEVFTSWGVETARKFTKAEVEHALTELDTGNYGMILRSKGIVDGGADGWLEFDYVPGEWEVRSRSADVGGKLVVIGSKLNETAIAQLFGC